MAGAALFPFVVSTVPWEWGTGQWNLTVCLKATFALAPGPGDPPLAEQTDGSHEDVFFEQTPHASLYSPSDYVPYKPRADILLVGHAHAPGGVAVETLVARLGVGSFVKALRILGDRSWVARPDGARGAQPSAPRPFTRMPVRYERAPRAGDNVVGLVGGDARQPPPSIEVATEACAAETPGFGPIAAAWRLHREPRAREALEWMQRLPGSRGGPAPAGLDAAVFNCAPRDQQVSEIAPGAPIRLDHLHARFPALTTRVPSVQPVVFHVDPASGAPREVPVNLDTLWIDTDREVFVLTWRGVLAIAPPRAAGIGAVLVAARGAGAAQRATFEEVKALVRAGARRPAPKTTALAAMPEPTATPFPLAAAGASSRPAAIIAGAPWADAPAIPAPKPGKDLEGTMPLGASLQHLIKPPPAVASGGGGRRKAAATAVLQQMPADLTPAAPFPLAEAGPQARSEAVAGAPWAGVSAAPVPRPSKELEGTMPLGASLADVVAQAQAQARVPQAAPTPPPAAPAAPMPPPPVRSAPTPEPAAPLWRVDEPAPPPAAAPLAPPPPRTDVKKNMYGDFTKKK